MKLTFRTMSLVASMAIFAFTTTTVFAQQVLNNPVMKHDVKIGIDLGVIPGGYSSGYNYTNNGGLYQSGANYRNGRALGGNFQFTERKGWTTEVRYRQQSISNPRFWYSMVGMPTQYWDSLSGAVSQYGGHFTAFDIIQRIPIKQHMMVRRGLFAQCDCRIV